MAESIFASLAKNTVLIEVRNYLAGILKTEDHSPPITSLASAEQSLAAGVHALLPRDDARTKVDLQFFVPDDVVGTTAALTRYMRVGFEGNPVAERFYHGGSTEQWTADAVSIEIVGGPGIVVLQTWAAG